jgi:hypothetical protein
MLCSYEGVIAFSTNTKAVLNWYVHNFFFAPKIHESNGAFPIFYFQHFTATLCCEDKLLLFKT